MDERIIFIDFDGTLFDVKRFKSELAKIFRDSAFFLPDFRAIRTPDFYRQNELYSLEKSIESIPDLKRRQEVERELELLFLNAPNFLFPDSIRFLKNFEKDILILITRGSDIQRKKIKNLNSGTLSLFREIIITENQKVNCVQKVLSSYYDGHQNIFFIDDNSYELIGVKTAFPLVFTIHVRRFGFGIGFETHSSWNASVKDLIEAKHIIDIAALPG